MEALMSTLRNQLRQKEEEILATEQKLATQRGEEAELKLVIETISGLKIYTGESSKKDQQVKESPQPTDSKINLRPQQPIKKSWAINQIPKTSEILQRKKLSVNIIEGHNCAHCKKEIEDDDEEKWIKHYSSRHQILLVGEGDFSFAACLATAFGNASNMIATSLDSQELLKKKHPTAAENLVLLKDKGCTVLHEINACSMSGNSILQHRRFDRIVFNFPHAGFTYRERDEAQISLHRGVVRGFLRNAYEMLTLKGEVHITHKVAHPYSEWKIVELGKEVGLQLSDREMFDIDEYPGYENKRGDGDCSNDSFPLGVCCTYKFAKLNRMPMFSYDNLFTDCIVEV